MAFKDLVSSICNLKSSSVGATVSARMDAFERTGRGSINSIFRELCFCLLTANYSAEGGIRIQSAIGGGFLTMPRDSLTESLKTLGYRFPNVRAKYIVNARDHLPVLSGVVQSNDEFSSRSWLVENVLGLGYKEASHFLRNVGMKNLAIIDFHIVDLLVEHGIITRPKSKSLRKQAYLEIESELATLADAASITQGELDLYLWYLETGKILK